MGNGRQCWNKNQKEKDKNNVRLIDKSSAYFHVDSQNTTPNFQSETRINPSETWKGLVSSNIIVNNLPESNDSDTKIKHAHDLEKVEVYIRSIWADNSTELKIK